MPSFNDFVVKACATALRENPLANGSYDDGEFVLHSRVNVGIAVAVRDALVVPTIFDADQKSLGEIARLSVRLAEKVRDGTITPPELAGGTFSVSNLGMFGVDEFSAVINPPQAAILAVGALKQRAVVIDGQLAARHTMTIALSCDSLRILVRRERGRVPRPDQASARDPGITCALTEGDPWLRSNFDARSGTRWTRSWNATSA